MEAARVLFTGQHLTAPNQACCRSSRRRSKVSYVSQLHFRQPQAIWHPTTTPPKPPRAQLSDPTAAKGMLYTATSRLGHDIIGVFAVNAIPLLPSILCAFVNSARNADMSGTGGTRTRSTCPRQTPLNMLSYGDRC
jgi:hypothetical protein